MKLWTVYDGATHWFATQSEAKTKKRDLVKTGIPQKDISLQPVEIPTRGRGELAQWLTDREVTA